MRALALALILVASPAYALDETQILGACYRDCDKEASGGPEYQACLARAADTADALLRDEFKALEESVSTAAKETDVRPEPQLEALKAVQDKWLAFRDSACKLEDTLSFGAPGAQGRLSSCICALSYGRINDFTRMRHTLLGR
jgi:uncharacterized protein YecT (DUF1311 family)